ncbi:MAG TPA: nucleotide pyrophosphohydrolase [Methanocella sp.]|uniref:nucleotide pyrophosphohydrolase n=1 Tax=Methanocella sp. TaxID=2052833 RepID=UPI002C8C4372|nr:nucleotide pyrophosphohydrolase [Methanocella sp.]HTY89835.1 nucleotide pyrophosphohydrolase [Methanocella sp.]
MLNDSTTAIFDLKSQVQAFCEARDWDQYHNAKDLAIGVSTEAGELLDLFRFKSPDEVEAIFHDARGREEVEDEIADVLFFLLRLGQKYDIDLTKAFERKLEKNAAKYPVETARGSNKKYCKWT